MILDQTGLVLAFEGGWGFDLENETAQIAHIADTMVMLVGGRADDLQ